MAARYSWHADCNAICGSPSRFAGTPVPSSESVPRGKPVISRPARIKRDRGPGKTRGFSRSLSSLTRRFDGLRLNGVNKVGESGDLSRVRWHGLRRETRLSGSAPRHAWRSSPSIARFPKTQCRLDKPAAAQLAKDRRGLSRWRRGNNDRTVAAFGSMAGVRTLYQFFIENHRPVGSECSPSSFIVLLVFVLAELSFSMMSIAEIFRAVWRRSAEGERSEACETTTPPGKWSFEG